MRPATRTDRQDIADLIRARTTWLRERGIDTALLDFSVAQDLAGEEGEDGQAMVWGACEDGQVFGVTVTLSTMPEGTWADDELRVPALLMTGTWTHPKRRSDQLGR
ncbi:hypothetical protein [Actinacidiphila sp. ITFR-21]|uniref:hypothetical protein n=1 Tax=Actinacidiphila sp. ITFR-21 TaxID=3075199 RepID=UPI00288AD1BA|nr:hypothetical protein [Streptomyces sp. ITFR-21]WNI16201.1 hypothetical protein RLT57_12110 [Streptomyces sp. ITFR-21]